jgi:type I restriction enzyme S subunit
MSYKTYPSTVRSGIGWLGDIPSHWAVLPAKALFALRSEKALPDDVHLTPSQKFGVLPQLEYMGITGSRVVLNLKDSGQMKHVEPNDFISHLRSFQGGLELSRIRGKVSGAYTVLKLRGDQNPDYWKYALKSDTYIQALQTTTDQLRDGQSIRLKEFAQIPLPLVPRAEQDSIVEFLDLELTQIDELIQRQLKLEELISTRKLSVISSHVYGLGASSLLIESPLLPHGWEWRKLKGVASVQASNVDKKIYEDGRPVKLCNYVDVYYNDEILEDLDFMDATATTNEIAKFTLRAGEVIITKDSESAADIGLSAYVPSDLPGVVCGYHLSILRPVAGLDGRFLKLVLDSAQAKSHFSKRANGLTRMALGQSAIGDLRVPMPPLAEQQRIASEVWSQIKNIDMALSASRKLVSSLRERRSALIAAAVTGKVKPKGA